MGHQLREQHLDNCMTMREKACENYICRSCGEKMISANFVNGICIQVFVSHSAQCRAFYGNAFARTREVSCDTCMFHDAENACTFDGAGDERISSVRTSCNGGNE